jgi:hypothetical protein
MTWTELVMGATSIQGEQPAVSDVRTGEVLSYAAFARKVTHASAGLRARGLRYGDHVLVDMPLGVGLAVAVHSVAWAGGVAILRSTGKARMMIAQRGYQRDQVDVEHVFTFEPAAGATPFGELMGERTVEFGPLAGPALGLGGNRILDHDELASDLRRLAARIVVGKDDVLLAAVSEPFRGLRVLDLSMMSGAHAVIAQGTSLIGTRVLASEYSATLVVGPYDLARRMLGDPALRVVDERALVSSLAL